MDVITLTQFPSRYVMSDGAGLWAGQLRFDPKCQRGGDFSSLLRVRPGPGVHSASYKMSTRDFPWGKGG